MSTTRLTRLTRLIAGGVASLLIGTGSASAQTVPESSDPIKIAINEWTGQHISAHVAGEVLRKMGYTVEYVTAGGVPQYAAIAQGSLHLQPEAWSNNVGDIFPKAVRDGDIVNVGSLGLKPRDGWIYPTYMQDSCPGLPDYKALINCASAFATPETFPKGRVIDYPADWATRSADFIANAELPFQAIPGGSEGAMIAELKSAYAAKQPLLMMMWAPHWIHAEYELGWIDFPAYDANCGTDATLGINPAKVDDCGFEQADVYKVVSRDFQKTWPAAYAFVERYSLDNVAQDKMMLEIDNKGRKLEEVVSEWLAANEAVWTPWIAAAK